MQAIEGMAEGLRSGRYGDIVVEWHGAHHGELGGRPRKALEVLVSSGYELFVVGRSRGRARLEPQTPDAVGAERVHLLCRAPHR